MSRPEVLNRFRQSDFLQVGDPKAPEDVETTLLVFQVFENWLEAVAQSVRLEHLGAQYEPTGDSGTEEPATRSPVDVATAEDATAWEMTMNSNDFPSNLNFILFLSSVNWIAVFNGMMVCSEGFG